MNVLNLTHYTFKITEPVRKIKLKLDTRRETPASSLQHKNHKVFIPSLNHHTYTRVNLLKQNRKQQKIRNDQLSDAETVLDVLSRINFKGNLKKSSQHAAEFIYRLSPLIGGDSFMSVDRFTNILKHWRRFPTFIQEKSQLESLFWFYQLFQWTNNRYSDILGANNDVNKSYLMFCYVRVTWVYGNNLNIF